jgi:hypothetical protein
MSEHVLDLPNIDDVEPVSEKDKLCIQEVREVLRKHNATRRFGLCLLHEHFSLAEQEVLVESCDDENRVLTVRPVPLETVKDKVMETSWRLDIERPTGRCISYCEREDGPNGPSHVRKHRATL